MPSRQPRFPRRWKYPDVRDHRLSGQDVVERIKDHGPNHYSGLYNVMKGVTLAGAGVAFAKLAGHGFPLSHVALMIVALARIWQ
jgi:hypothetical protein